MRIERRALIICPISSTYGMVYGRVIRSRVVAMVLTLIVTLFTNQSRAIVPQLTPPPLRVLTSVPGGAGVYITRTTAGLFTNRP